MRVRGWIAISVVAALVVVAGVSAAGGVDWGANVEKDMNSGRSNQVFGVDKPLLSTSTASLTQAEALAHPEDLVTLAKSLKASVVAAGPTDNVGVNADQMVLWPPSHPTHIILVNEEGTGEAGLLAPKAALVKATGYYRPEDIDIDAAALAAGNVRFCGNNTGRDAAKYWGETVCITDGTVAGSTGSTTPEVQLLVEGSRSINMPDNIAYQATTGNWIVHEDGSTGTRRPESARTTTSGAASTTARTSTC